jgi:predicted nucleotidyltransferase
MGGGGWQSQGVVKKDGNNSNIDKKRLILRLVSRSLTLTLSLRERELPSPFGGRVGDEGELAADKIVIKDKIMSNQNPSPTPYPEANIVLNVLLPDVQAILGNQFIGMYLYGSLAYGGFDQDSDVDFVVVTREELPETFFSALQAMHARIAMLDSWCATQLEGSYIPKHALQTYDPIRVLHLHIDRGREEKLHRMQIDDPLISRAWWGGWVLLRAALLEIGTPLAGPAPATLITPVSPDELRQAMLATLEGWVEPLLENPEQIKYRGYQSYFVLTLCRILYTLKYVAIASKPVAAHWAQERLGEPWAALIERAWAGRHNPGAQASPEDVNGTLDYIRYTLEHSQ